MGRKKLPPGEKRTIKVHSRVNDKESEILQQAYEISGQVESDFVRESALKQAKLVIQQHEREQKEEG